VKIKGEDKGELFQVTGIRLEGSVL